MRFSEGERKTEEGSAKCVPHHKRKKTVSRRFEVDPRFPWGLRKFELLRKETGGTGGGKKRGERGNLEDLRGKKGIRVSGNGGGGGKNNKVLSVR